jgi:hypothetical protein
VVPFEPEGFGAYDMIVVRGCGVERIRVRTLAEMVESLADAGAGVDERSSPR